MFNETTTGLALTLALGLFAGCETATDEGRSATTDGQALYAAPHDDGNTFACATCHALHEPADDGITRPGHPIGDAAARATFKNGQLSGLVDAVNSCREDWMGAPAFTEDDPRWLALRDFLVAEAGDTTAESITYDIVDPPADVSGGDPVAGAAAFDRTCAVCHGPGAAGSERAPSLLGTPETADFIALKVRRSGNPSSDVYPDLVPGRMPFWAADRLTDDGLRDIVAFLGQTESTTPINGDEMDLSLPNAQSDCGSSHPMVGQSLTFMEKAHDVGGTATVVDDCTILFEDFSFDGGGIDVRIYGGENGSYDDGATMSVNLVGTAFERNKAVLRLPEGISLGDFDGLSVWCVPVGFSFGDGQFE